MIKILTIYSDWWLKFELDFHYSVSGHYTWAYQEELGLWYGQGVILPNLLKSEGKLALILPKISSYTWEFVMTSAIMCQYLWPATTKCQYFCPLAWYVCLFCFVLVFFRGGIWFGFMMYNATFNNISVISWQSILLVGKTGVPGENHRPTASHWQTLPHNNVHPALSGIRLTNERRRVNVCN